MLENLYEIRMHGGIVESIEVRFSERRANGKYNLWITRKDGKLHYKTNELAREELAEVKRLAKNAQGEYVGWKSDACKIADAKNAAAWQHGYVYEDEFGNMHVGTPEKEGTWFSDQDENRNF